MVKLSDFTGPLPNTLEELKRYSDPSSFLSPLSTASPAPEAQKPPPQGFNLCPYQPYLNTGVDLAKLSTSVLCFGAAATGGTNLVFTTGCAAGGVVSGLGSVATSQLAKYCNQPR